MDGFFGPLQSTDGLLLDLLDILTAGQSGLFSCNRTVCSQDQLFQLLTVLGDDQQIIRLGSDYAHVPLDHSGAVLTRKLADTLGAAPGDVITCRLPGSDETFDMPVVQIVHNNLNQGMYLTRSAWEALRKGAFVPTTLYLQSPAPATLEKLSGWGLPLPWDSARWITAAGGVSSNSSGLCA